VRAKLFCYGKGHFLDKKTYFSWQIKVTHKLAGHFSANRQMDGQTDGQMFGHFSANRQMERQTDGQTEFANFDIDYAKHCSISLMLSSKFQLRVSNEIT